MGTFSGIVIEGSKRARALGYPTVNIVLKEAGISGVYAAIVRIDKTIYHGAAFADPSRSLLEANVFGLTEEVYGRTVSIELKQKIRDSVRYERDELLKEAIRADVLAVREYFHV
ncbi:MAG: riboflavin biosynthesis protein RibF [Candidatus Kaiserbacteria bacterium]|nr:riboflavin biosynthesis protein RibF [Candidatus Kaiserbacteria bacterium]